MIQKEMLICNRYRRWETRDDRTYYIDCVERNGRELPKRITTHECITWTAMFHGQGRAAIPRPWRTHTPFENQLLNTRSRRA